MPPERHSAQLRRPRDGHSGRGGDTRAGHLDRASKTWRGKARRKQALIVHKASVKKSYARVLKREEDDTPEFYKEIFAQVDVEKQADRTARGTSDEEGAKVAYDSSAPQSRQRAVEHSAFEQHEDDSEGSARYATSPSKRSTHKPNPFRKAQLAMEEQQRELERIREQDRLNRDEAKQQIASKKRQRQTERKRMLSTTRSGQPSMSGRIANMLDRLKST